MIMILIYYGKILNVVFTKTDCYDLLKTALSMAVQIIYLNVFVLGMIYYLESSHYF